MAQNTKADSEGIKSDLCIFALRWLLFSKNEICFALNLHISTETEPRTVKMTKAYCTVRFTVAGFLPAKSRGFTFNFVKLHISTIG